MARAYALACAAIVTMTAGTLYACSLYDEAPAAPEVTDAGDAAPFAIEASVDASDAADAAAAATTYIYVVGSPAVRAAVFEDGGLGVWEKIETLTTARGAAGFVVADAGEVVLVGGDEDPLVRLSSVIVTSLRDPAPTWSQAPGLPLGVSGPAAASHAGVIYSIGGRSGPSQPESTVFAASLSDTGLSPWTTTSSLPFPLANEAAVVLGSRLYVVAGFGGGGNTSTVLSTTFESDGGLGTFVDAGAFPEATAETATAVVGDRLVSAGGVGINADALSDCFVGTMGPDGSIAWVGTTPMIEGRRAACAVSVGSNIYVIGGYVGAAADNKVTDTVFIGSLDSKGGMKWGQGPHLPTANAYQPCAVITR